MECMIKFVNEEISKAIAFLNAEYPTQKDVFIHVCEGYDTIETPDGCGFGVFVKQENENEIPTIYIAGDMPNNDFRIAETIAHEYRHFMQWCNGDEFSEEQAEDFAREVVVKLCGKQ